MSTNEQRPNVQWDFPPEKPRSGRVWLIVGLSVLVLLIAAALTFFLIPRDGGATPVPSSSATPSATPTRTPTPTPTPTVTPTLSPAPIPSTPATEPPPPVDPGTDAFAAAVAPRLDDAATGLNMILEGNDALPIIDQLELDAQRLADTPAPSAIDAEWRDAVGSYESSLRDLRDAANASLDLSDAVSVANAAVQRLRSIAGL